MRRTDSKWARSNSYRVETAIRRCALVQLIVERRATDASNAVTDAAEMRSLKRVIRRGTSAITQQTTVAERCGLCRIGWNGIFRVTVVDTL